MNRMKRKNNVALICDVGELAGLFDKSSSLGDFLQTVVSTVAYHMRAAVCSIYLYDEETEELVLRANQGLHPDSIGKVRLKLGEGLTGKAMQELRPVREAEGRHNPIFKYIPDIGEEAYSSFLAVPIIRNLTKVGTLVVQDAQSDYFDDNDLKALQAIAAQLAATIENANLIISLHHMQEKAEGRPLVKSDYQAYYHGTTASEGMAYGKAVVLGRRERDFSVDDSESEGPFTLESFRAALKTTELQLEELQSQMEERMSDVASLIFSAHLLILKDDGFSWCHDRSH